MLRRQRGGEAEDASEKKRKKGKKTIDKLLPPRTRQFGLGATSELGPFNTELFSPACAFVKALPLRFSVLSSGV